MELYMAVDSYTGEVRVFSYFGDLREHAKKNGYGCDYYSLGSVRQYYASELETEA